MSVKKASQATPNLLLRQARQARGWTQQEVATLIDAPHAYMINRWESGAASPSAVYRKRLVALFEQDLTALGLLPPRRVVPAAGASPMLYDSAIPLPFANDRALIGRDVLLADVRQQLCGQKGQIRIALNGLPGVGKTTLAVALAHDTALQECFHDGVLWIGLGPQPNLLALLSRWGGLLGISQSEAEALKDQESWLQWLRDAIGDKHLLLVIDDAWSIEGAQTCLVGGPNCSYLLTTRQLDVALQFAGTNVVQVPELNQDESIRLLVQLAPTVAQVDAETVHELARVTGGLPLALTLLVQHLLVQTGQPAGRRFQTALTRLQRFEERVRLQQPQAGLQRDFRLPASSALSLHAIIGLSETGLVEDARQMLSALAVFPAKPDSFTEEAALAIAQGPVEALDSLVDAGLIESIGQGRYTLHQTIADYARAQSPNGDAKQRLAGYYRDFLVRHHTDFLALEPETANIIQALQCAVEHDRHEWFIQGVLAFVPFLQNRAQHQLVARYLELAERFARASNDPLALISLLQLSGQTAFWQGNYEQAEAAYQEGLQLAVQNDDPKQVCQLLLGLGRLAGRRGAYKQAERFFQEGLPLARQLADHECACNLLQGLGALAGERGDYTQAHAFFNESLTLARQIASEELICKSLSNLAVIAAEQAHFGLAEHYWQEVLPIARQMQWNEQLSITLFNLGTLMKDQGDFVRAERYFEECLALDRKLAHRERLGQVLAEFSTLLRKQAAYDRAWVYLREGLELAKQMGHRRLLSDLWLEVGELSLQTGQLTEAEQAFRETLVQIPEGQHSLDVGARYGLARVAALRGNLDEARRLGKECLASFTSSGYLRLEEVRDWLDSLPLS